MPYCTHLITYLHSLITSLHLHAHIVLCSTLLELPMERPSNGYGKVWQSCFASQWRCFKLQLRTPARNTRQHRSKQRDQIWRTRDVQECGITMHGALLESGMYMLVAWRFLNIATLVRLIRAPPVSSKVLVVSRCQSLRPHQLWNETRNGWVRLTAFNLSSSLNGPLIFPWKLAKTSSRNVLIGSKPFF